MNQNEKGNELKGWQLSLAGVKLEEIKSLEAIKCAYATIGRI